MTDQEHFADPQDKKLPISDAKHVAIAITALQGGGLMGNKVEIDKGKRASIIANIDRRIGELPISDDEKSHLRDRLHAVKSLSVYAAPKPVDVWDRIRGKEGVAIYKGADGRRYLFIVTSNSYKDRENETIATKALQSYVDRAWRVEDKCLPDNPLLFWHDGQPIGDIVWTDMEGPFLLEVAKERPNKPVTLTTKGIRWTTTVKAVWDAIEKGKYRWGASHGFRYRDGDLTNGIYKQIAKFETSVLPLEAAANPFTFAGVLNDMNKDEFLTRMIREIPDLAKSFRRGTRQLKQELDKQGLEHKAVELEQTKGIMDKLSAAIDAFIMKVTENADPSLKDQLLTAIVTAMTSGAMDTTAEPDGDEDTTNVAYDAMPADEGDVNTVSEETKKPAAENAVTGKQIKAWEAVIKSLETVTEDSVANREALTEVVKAIKPLADLPEQVKSISDRLAEVESKLKGAPRRAAADTTTVVRDESLAKASKDLTENKIEIIPGSGLFVRPASNGKS